MCLSQEVRLRVCCPTQEVDREGKKSSEPTGGSSSKVSTAVRDVYCSLQLHVGHLAECKT